MTPIHVMHVITDLDVGGAERMLARLVTASDRRRFQMSVVSLIPPGPIGVELRAQGVEVYSLGMKRGWIDPRGVWRLVRLLRRRSVDVVQTWLYHADLLGLLAARLAGARCVVWNLRCSDMELSRYSALSATVVRLLAWLSRLPTLVIANSLAGQAVHQRLGYRPQRWEIVPNGIDVSRFRPDPALRQRLRAEWALPPASFVICLPARVDPMKDHATFLAAADRFARVHADAGFVLVGRGTDQLDAARNGLLARISCADKVRLLGERSDMPAVLAAADVVALSSAFGEGFPNVIAEAMACGVPVVSTDVGDVARIIDGAGIVVPPRDPEAMAQAWRQLYEMGADRRAEMGRRGWVRVNDHYALRQIVARYEAIYQDLVQA